MQHSNLEYQSKVGMGLLLHCLLVPSMESNASQILPNLTIFYKKLMFHSFILYAQGVLLLLGFLKVLGLHRNLSYNDCNLNHQQHNLYRNILTLIVTYFPVEPKVSIAYYSPSSIFYALPPLTIGTLFPA